MYSVIMTIHVGSSGVDLERGKAATKVNLATSFNATNGTNLRQKTSNQETMWKTKALIRG